MRVKRGLINTEEPGGFYKDQVYLKGAVDILKNRDKVGDKWPDLYSGRLALEDVLEGSKVMGIKREGLKMPSFIENLDGYRAAIDEIARVNFIK